MLNLKRNNNKNKIEEEKRGVEKTNEKKLI